jgi:hypothetical protein
MNAAIPLTSLDRKLLRWLDEDEAKFERYIAKHPEAADRVDELLALGPALQQALSNALAAAVAAPSDLAARISASFDFSNDTSIGSVVMDLFGVGLATTQVWIDE